MGIRDERTIKAWKAIDEILWKVWDPIGVNMSVAARNEYYGYIHGIFHLLEAGTDKQVLAEHLYKIETERMELQSNKTHCLQVAQHLMQIDRT